MRARPSPGQTSIPLASPLLPSAGILLALGAVVMVQPIFAAIAASFRLPPLAVRASFSLGTLAYAVAFFLLGPLTDRVSLTTMGLLSALGLALSVALSGLSPGFLLFNLSMVLMGVCAAGLVGSMFPY